MAKIEWDNSLALGIPVIDEQHQALFRLMSYLVEASFSGQSVDLDKIFNQLHDYVDKHFTFEEKLFQQFGYVHAAEHKQFHEGLTKTLQMEYQKYKEGSLTNSELMEFLQTWISGHIAVEDKKYAEVLRDKINNLFPS